MIRIWGAAALLLMLGACATDQPAVPPLKKPAKASPYAPPPPHIPGDAVACTMDVRQCADGSAVGRIAPDCEFAACPDTNKP